MSRVDEIRNRLAKLDPASIDIRDDSALHAGHAGARAGGGHFHLEIVSDHFEGLNTLARHRLVYDTLSDLMQGPIHALAIQAKTTTEAGLSPSDHKDDA